MSAGYERYWFATERRATREVRIGKVGVGGANPIRVQSMITCDTMDTAASIQQTLDLAAAGCEIVRITAPTVKDARNLEHIKAGLLARGCDVPLVADIHFKPEAAMEAANWVEKVRINPAITPTRKSSRPANTPTPNTTPSSAASVSGSPLSSRNARPAASRSASARTTEASATAS